jgi:hypothetical protein
MASETYQIIYDVVDRAGPKIDVLIQKITTLGKLLDDTGEKLKNLGSGNRGLGSVNKNLEFVVKNLDKTVIAMKAVEVQAPKTQAELKTLGEDVPLKVDKGTTSIERFGASLLALQAGMLVVRKVGEALDAMGESAAKAREFQDKGGQAGLDKRGKAREYANLMNHEGPDDAVMSRLFSLGQAGGYKFDDAVKYGEQFLGSSPAGVQAGHVTPEQLKKLEVEGARFANRIGLDPATGGDIAGVIPQYVDMTKDANGRALTTDQGVNKAMGQLGALQYGLNEGRGKITTLMRSEIGAAAPALAAGRIQDHAEMGAFVGIASTFSKSASSPGTNFKQMDSLINNSEGDEGSNQKGDYLKRIGVAGARGDLAKLRALKADVDAQRKANPNLDVSSYLTEKGFHNRAERDSTIGYIANFDVLEKRTIEARKRAENGQDVVDANRKYSTSLEGQNQLGDAAAEKAEYEQTEKRQRLVVARKFALAQLRKEGKIDTTAANFEDWAMDFVSGPTRQWSGEMESRATAIDARVRENLAKGGLKAGVDLEKAYPGFAKGYGEGVNWNIDQVTNDVGPLMEREGVGLDGSGGPSGAPAGRKLKVVMPPSLAAEKSGFDDGGGGGKSGFDDGGGGAAEIVGAVDQIGGKIDRQTEALVSAIRGWSGGSGASGSGGGVPPMQQPAGNGGAGVNPGRR